MIAVLDTNIIIAGLRSRLGASHALLVAVADGRLDYALSVPLLLEYEAVLKRPEMRSDLGLSIQEIDVILDGLAARAKPVRFNFLWRPQLRDPGDEMVLATAVNAGAAAIVTFNSADFLPAASQFGIHIEKPAVLLSRLARRKP